MSDMKSGKKPHRSGAFWLRQILLFSLLLFLVVWFAVMLGVKDIPYTSLDQYVRTDIYPADGGEVRHYNSNTFPSPRRGDRLVFTIQLSEVKNVPENPVLCFYNYNSRVSVTCGDHDLYSHGWKQSGQSKPTGHTIVRVPLPPLAAGPSTEAPAGSTSGLPTESSTESQAESTSGLPTESQAGSTSGLPTESSTESQAESSSELPTESSTESQAESTSGLPTESSTESQAESSSGLPSGSSSGASGQTVAIEFLQMEDHTTSSLERVVLLPAQYAWLYPVLTMSSQINAVLFTLFFYAASIVFFIFTVLNVRGTEVLKGIYLALFCLCMTVWMMGYTSCLFVLTNDLKVAPYIEYYGIFLAPAFFYGYLAMCSDAHRKKVAHILAAVSSGIFAIAFLWHEFIPPHSGFVALLPVCYLELITAALVFLSYLHRGIEKGSRILKWGITATFFIGLLEIVRAFIIKMGWADSPLLYRLNEVVLTPYIVVALEVTLVIDYIAKWYQMYLRQLQMDKLAAIAYTDSLTGLNNRSAFYEHEKPNLESQSAYSIAFIDADGLKEMNDTYGHKAGDLLLISVSRAIRYGCKESGCRAYRFGGDEFLIVGEIEEKVDSAVAFMKENLAESENSFTGKPVTVSVGIAKYPSLGASVEDTLKEADRRMYKEKERCHKKREDQ